MRPSGAERALALAGLLGAALGAWWLARLPAPGGPRLASLYQRGFGEAALALAQAPEVEAAQRQELGRRWERARRLAGHGPQDLRATPAFVLRDDGRFWPKACDLHPLGAMVVKGQGPARRLLVEPSGGAPWSVAMRSEAQVDPDWSPVSGLVAYYDLGRVWIADVAGRQYQSLAQVPGLEQGGELRFSADGTSLAYHARKGGAWMAFDFYAIKP